MKKIILFMLIMLATLCVFVGCECEHEYGEWEVTKKATCTENGEETRYCTKCDEAETAVVDAKGHTPIPDAAVDATCLVSGKTAGSHCSECGTTLVTQNTVPSTGHAYTKEVVDAKYLKSEATCTAKAVYYKSCVCGEKSSDTFESGEKLPHTFDQEKNDAAYIKSEASCTAVAVYYKSCSCGEKGTETFESGEPLPHTHTSYTKTKDANCTDNAQETSLCDVCDFPHVRDIADTALGHGEVSTANVCPVCQKEVEYTKGMVYIAVTGGYQLIDIGTTTDTEIIIPKYYEGQPVISIGAEVFYNKSNLTKIEMPDTIASIGEDAFYNCSGLTELEFPVAVKELPYAVLRGCKSLKKLTLPLTIKLYGLTDNELISAFGSYSVDSTPDNVDKAIIANMTFMYSGYIGSEYRYVYSHLPASLETVIITCSVDRIDGSVISDRAFTGCSNIKTIILPDTIEAIGVNAFSLCSGLTNIVIPDSVKVIEDRAFDGCKNLESITLPKNLTSIGSYVFQNCTKITGITIPGKVTSIGSYAFNGMTALESIFFEKTTGWTVNSSSIDVTNTSTNVLLFTKTYVNKSWTRS